MTQARALDRDRAKECPELHGVISLTALRRATMRAELLHLQKRPQLLCDDDLPEGFEDPFPFGEGKVQSSGAKVLPLQAGDFPRLCLALVGGDDDLNRVLHGGTPSCGAMARNWQLTCRRSNRSG